MRTALILLSSAPGQRRAVHLLLIEDDVRIASLLERDESVTERIPRPTRPKGRTGRHEIVVWYRSLEQSVLARSQDVRFVVLLSAQLAIVLAYSIVSAVRTTKSREIPASIDASIDFGAAVTAAAWLVAIPEASNPHAIGEPR